MTSIPDTHPDLQLYRYRSGIKLVRPEKTKLSSGHDTGYAVADAFKLPFNVGFLNLENCVENLNSHSANILGFADANEARGRSMYDIAQADSAKLVEMNNKQVVDRRAPQVFEQHIIKKDDFCINRLQFVTPWYDDRDAVIGVFGCNLVLGVHPLAKSLMQIAELGFMQMPDKSLSGRHVDGIYLTKRESDIMYHTARGKTAKRIAHHLGISFRTVEYHLENIKSKFLVTSKSELIDKIGGYYID